MKKNGFTLIELLAIIVILAIIAVITVPIILNIIDNSKMGAATDSAYGYKDSINKWYVSKLSKDSNYNIPNGEYKVGELGEQIEGQKPDSDLSWFKVTNNEVTDGCLQFDEYMVEISSGKVGDAVKGECKGNEYVPLTGEVLDNIASYDTMEIVYYNPIDGKKCTDYVSNNSKPGFDGVVSGVNSTKTEDDQTSCLKWYKYSTNIDGSINMILDHNSSTGKSYYSSSNNNINGPSGNNTNGPLSLMSTLDFDDWSTSLTRSDKYTAYVDSNGTKTVLFTNVPGNAIDYSGKKARLITAQEIAEITGATLTTSPGISWDEHDTSSNDFFFGSLDKLKNYSSQNVDQKMRQEKFYWLFENLKHCELHGCSPNGDNEHTQPGNSVETGNYGYWTSSPYAFNPYGAWSVYCMGDLSWFSTSGSHYGVRPVITIPAS